MIELALEIITAAAVAAGLDAEAVMIKPDQAVKIALPKPRLEVEILTEDVERNVIGWARLPGVEPGTEIIRKRTHRTDLKTRCAIIQDKTGPMAWIERFKRDFLAALPGKTADEDNNLITVRPDSVKRGGFGGRMVDVMKTRESVVWITFEGGIYRDDVAPLMDGDVKLEAKF